MKKINNQGFTLVEVLAVVVILGILIAIMIPNVNNLLKKNEEENYNKLIESIENAARLYVSDYRYEITLESNTCGLDGTIGVLKIGNTELSENSQIPIQILVANGTLETEKDEKIYDPRNKEQYLDLNNNYVTIRYQCEAKDYTYEVVNNEYKLVNKERDFVWIK